MKDESLWDGECLSCFKNRCAYKYMYNEDFRFRFILGKA